MPWPGQSRASRLPVPADAGQGGPDDSQAHGCPLPPPPPPRRPAAGLHPGCYREPRPEVQVCVCVCVCGGGKRARGAGGASGGVRAPAGGCQRRRPALPYSRAGGARGRRQRNFEHRVSQEAREGSQTGWCLMSVAGTATLGHRCRCRTMPAEALPLSPVIERLGPATVSETSLSERMTPAKALSLSLVETTADPADASKSRHVASVSVMTGL